jgi:hypothetical protein
MSDEYDAAYDQYDDYDPDANRRRFDLVRQYSRSKQDLIDGLAKAKHVKVRHCPSRRIDPVKKAASYGSPLKWSQTSR